MEDTFEFICPTKIYYRPEGVSEIGRIIVADAELRCSLHAGKT